LPEALGAWLAFRAPCIGIGLFRTWRDGVRSSADSAWLHGLKVVAVAVVAQAVWEMAKNLYPDRERATIAVCSRDDLRDLVLNG
jgi:chromate transporter